MRQSNQKSSAFLAAEMLRRLYGKQCGPRSQTAPMTAPIGAVCSGSTLLASILNSSVMLGNYLQQTTSADDIFRCTFFWLKTFLLEGHDKMSLLIRIAAFQNLEIPSTGF